MGSHPVSPFLIIKDSDRKCGDNVKELGKYGERARRIWCSDRGIIGLSDHHYFQERRRTKVEEGYNLIKVLISVHDICDLF